MRIAAPVCDEQREVVRTMKVSEQRVYCGGRPVRERLRPPPTATRARSAIYHAA